MDLAASTVAVLALGLAMFLSVFWAAFVAGAATIVGVIASQKVPDAVWPKVLMVVGSAATLSSAGLFLGGFSGLKDFFIFRILVDPLFGALPGVSGPAMAGMGILGGTAPGTRPGSMVPFNNAVRSEIRKINVPSGKQKTFTDAVAKALKGLDEQLRGWGIDESGEIDVRDRKVGEDDGLARIGNRLIIRLGPASFRESRALGQAVQSLIRRNTNTPPADQGEERRHWEETFSDVDHPWTISELLEYGRYVSRARQAGLEEDLVSPTLVMARRTIGRVIGGMVAFFRELDPEGEQSIPIPEGMGLGSATAQQAGPETTRGIVDALESFSQRMTSTPETSGMTEVFQHFRMASYLFSCYLGFRPEILDRPEDVARTVTPLFERNYRWTSVTLYLWALVDGGNADRFDQEVPIGNLLENDIVAMRELRNIQGVHFFGHIQFRGQGNLGLLQLGIREILFEEPFYHLLENAALAAPRDNATGFREGWVGVEVRDGGEHVEIRITNEYHGSEPLDLERLVVPHRSNRADGDTEFAFDAEARVLNQVGGKGLGLAYADAAVRFSGGQLRIEHDDGLVTFVVQLPKAQRSEFRSMRASSVSEAGDKKRSEFHVPTARLPAAKVRAKSAGELADGVGWRGVLRTAAEVTGFIFRIEMTVRPWWKKVKPQIFREHDRSPVEVVETEAPLAIGKAFTEVGETRRFIEDQRSSVPGEDAFGDIAVLVDMAARDDKMLVVQAIVGPPEAVRDYRRKLEQYLAEHTRMKRLPFNFKVMSYCDAGKFMGSASPFIAGFLKAGYSAALITDGELPQVEQLHVRMPEKPGQEPRFLRVIGSTLSREQTSAVIASAAELLDEATVRELMKRHGFIKHTELSGFNAILDALNDWRAVVDVMARAA